MPCCSKVAGGVCMSSFVLRLHYPFYIIAAVGKSAFGMYAAFRAVKEGRTVIYNSRKAGRFLLKGTHAFQLPSADMTNVRELDDAGTLYISDALPAAPANASFRLIISSPSAQKSSWSENFTEAGTMLCAMPPLEDTEMWALHAACFSDQPAAGVAERMRKWGNNPRHVFAKGLDTVFQDTLETAAGSLKMFALLRALTQSPGLDAFASKEHRHRLLKLVTKGSVPGSDLLPSQADFYAFAYCDIASHYIWEKCVAQLEEEQRKILYSFLHKSAEDPAAAGFRGVLYERLTVATRRRPAAAAAADRLNSRDTFRFASCGC